MQGEASSHKDIKQHHRHYGEIKWSDAKYAADIEIEPSRPAAYLPARIEKAAHASAHTPQSCDWYALLH